MQSGMFRMLDRFLLESASVWRIEFFSFFLLFFFFLNLLQPRLTTNVSEGEEKIDTGLKKKKKKKKSSLVSNLRHERTKGEILLQGHPT